jgi:hypothetical protein
LGTSEHSDQAGTAPTGSPDVSSILALPKAGERREAFLDLRLTKATDKLSWTDK